ncbi:tetraspanin-19 isoform 6-T6 [Liasis olivaceus]
MLKKYSMTFFDLKIRINPYPRYPETLDRYLFPTSLNTNLAQNARLPSKELHCYRKCNHSDRRRGRTRLCYGSPNGAEQKESEEINLRWKAKMDQLISNYGNKHLIETEQWNILDVFQRMLHCCGQHNFTDWKVNEHKEHVDQIPCSCTTLNTMKWFCDPVQDAIYTRGCAKDIRIWYEENIWLLISINTGLLLVEVFQLVAAASLFTIMRKNVILPTN